MKKNSHVNLYQFISASNIRTEYFDPPIEYDRANDSGWL